MKACGWSLLVLLMASGVITMQLALEGGFVSDPAEWMRLTKSKLAILPTSPAGPSQEVAFPPHDQGLEARLNPLPQQSLRNQVHTAALARMDAVGRLRQEVARKKQSAGSGVRLVGLSDDSFTDRLLEDGGATTSVSLAMPHPESAVPLVPLLPTKGHEFNSIMFRPTERCPTSASNAAAAAAEAWPLAAKDWEQRTFAAHNKSGYVHFSAYRMNESKFAAMGLQNRVADRHMGSRLATPAGRGAQHAEVKRAEEGIGDTRCFWNEAQEEGGGKRLEGYLEFLYSGEHHDKQMDLLVIHCTLTEATGACGGYLSAHLGGDEVVLFTETPASVAPMSSSAGSPAALPSLLTFCGPPLHSDLRLSAVFEWMEYHRVHLGPDHYQFYDAGVWSQELAAQLKPYTDAGQLELTDFRGQEGLPVWFHAQTLALQDCLYRSRVSAKWIFVADFDEYLEAVPPNTLTSLLTAYQLKTWLSFGGHWWDVNQCSFQSKAENDESKEEGGRLESILSSSFSSLSARFDKQKGGQRDLVMGKNRSEVRGGSGGKADGSGRGEEFLVERMKYRGKGFFCSRTDGPTCVPGKADWPGQLCKGLFGELCNANFGRRKYFANPQKAVLLRIHDVALPAADGLPLNARQQFRLHHFRWLAAGRAASSFCNVTYGSSRGSREGEEAAEGPQLHGDGDGDSIWVYDPGVAKRAAAARQCPLGRGECEARLLLA
eukprot:TRINITY_DN12413_c0_g3_i2.p1 TRINITY_DN12413_c0_g3~~TRINITY_DN12413_c0_g3_i2.p1  ORF type:complete len:715 (+),score=150.60 TRINITY_DN12413_c0_g3_i2:227-2371(+)